MTARSSIRCPCGADLVDLEPPRGQHVTETACPKCADVEQISVVKNLWRRKGAA